MNPSVLDRVAPLSAGRAGRGGLSHAAPGENAANGKRCNVCGEVKPRSAFPIKKGAKCRDCDRKRHAAWRENNREQFRECKANWQRENRVKRAAHKAVERAILRGEITAQPCERCGHAVGIQAHHDDYSKPLEITWLCPRHHGERHRELRAAARQREGEAA